jgi:hydrogenase maturation factor
MPAVEQPAARRASRGAPANEAVPMTVLAVDEERALALCGTERGSRLSVEVSLLAPVLVGEVLLVQAGMALARASAPG